MQFEFRVGLLKTFNLVQYHSHWFLCLCVVGKKWDIGYLISLNALSSIFVKLEWKANKRISAENTANCDNQIVFLLACWWLTDVEVFRSHRAM